MSVDEGMYVDGTATLWDGPPSRVGERWNWAAGVVAGVGALSAWGTVALSIVAYEDRGDTYATDFLVAISTTALALVASLTALVALRRARGVMLVRFATIGAGALLVGGRLAWFWDTGYHDALGSWWARSTGLPAAALSVAVGVTVLIGPLVMAGPVVLARREVPAPGSPNWGLGVVTALFAEIVWLTAVMVIEYGPALDGPGGEMLLSSLRIVPVFVVYVASVLVGVVGLALAARGVAPRLGVVCGVLLGLVPFSATMWQHVETRSVVRMSSHGWIYDAFVVTNNLPLLTMALLALGLRRRPPLAHDLLKP